MRPPAQAAWPKAAAPHTEQEYHGWSCDFIELCDAQLQLLLSTMPQISQALLLFRRENPTTGALEFVPLVVHSRRKDDRLRRIWISRPGSAQHTELEEAAPGSPILPGSIPADWILPGYPFKTVGEQGGIAMPDGGLCIPVEYNGVLAGSVLLCPEAPAPADQQPISWESEDIKRADMVAKSIALGAALEGKWHADASRLGAGRALIGSMRALLRTTLHQVRSPVSALVTFGHLLLRKLPPGDANRALAKNIILEALRIDELLEPLDEAGDMHVLPEAAEGPVPWYSRDEEELHSINSSVEIPAQEDSTRFTPPPTYTKDSSTNGLQLLWLSDVLTPQADIAKVLASEKKISFFAEIDDDTPPVLAVEKYVREAVSNLIDNSLKYSPPGSCVGLYCGAARDDEGNIDSDSLENVVEVLVWDTGYGFSDIEREDVWEFGYRGSAATLSGQSGSGIGLSAVREMLTACGAEIQLHSPLPQYLDLRDHDYGDIPPTPGSAFRLRFKRPVR